MINSVASKFGIQELCRADSAQLASVIASIKNVQPHYAVAPDFVEALRLARRIEKKRSSQMRRVDHVALTYQRTYFDMLRGELAQLPQFDDGFFFCAA